MQAVAGKEVSAVCGHGVVTSGLGHVEVRAVEDDPGHIVAGAGQGVEQRGPGGFIQADGGGSDLRHLGEIRDRRRGEDLFDGVTADAVAQEQLLVAEHFQFERLVGRANLAQALQFAEGHEAPGGAADRRWGFQAQGEEGVQVGGGEVDPALGVAFDVDHAQDGQGGVAGDDFGEAAQGVFEFGHGQLDDGMSIHGMVDD